MNNRPSCDRIKAWVMTAMFMFLLPGFSTGQGFRQQVTHHLKAELDDVRYVITGTDSILYKNNAPDTLTFIMFLLWPDAYQQGSILSEQLLQRGDGVLHYAGRTEQGEISGLVFRVNGKFTRWSFPDMTKDYCKVELPEPLLPGDSIFLTLMFRLQIPLVGPGQLGHDGNAYFLTHWFPRPAIYSGNGWHVSTVNWKGLSPGEFSDINLSLTLPRNYVVASSGMLMDDPEEEQWMQKIHEKTSRISRWAEREEAAFPASASKTKTIKVSAKQVNDFVICMDKRFHHLRDTLQWDEGKRSVEIHLYFTPVEATYWSSSMDDVKNAMRFMISKVGDYPYPRFSVVQTPWYEDEATYPALIRIGTVLAPQILKVALARQVAIHWFSAAVGLDMVQSPWAIYGPAGYFSAEYLRESGYDTLSLQDLLTDPSLDFNLAGLKMIPVTHLGHLKMAYFCEDEAHSGVLPAGSYTRKNYIAAVQERSLTTFSTLAGYTGKERFESNIRRFYAEWLFRYPSAEDFRQSLVYDEGKEEILQHLDQLLGSEKYPNYRIIHSKRTQDGYRISIRNRSGMITPVPVTASAKTVDKTIWVPPFAGTTEFVFSDTTHSIVSFTIDKYRVTPELARRDNMIRTRGILRRIEPPVLVPVVALPVPEVTQINLSPVIGWNYANGFLAGIGSYSNPIIRPRTEYLLMPLYGFKNHHPAGLARLEQRFFPVSGKFSRISAGIEIKIYGLENMGTNHDSALSYSRLMPWIEFQLRKSSPLDPARHRFRCRSLVISKYNSNTKEPFSIQDPVWYYVNEISWRYRINRVLNPFHMQASIQQSDNMVRLMAEENWFIPYENPGKGFSIRAFSGIFLHYKDRSDGVDFRFTTSGIAMNTDKTVNIHDPLFDYLYLARSNAPGILRQQMYITDGGFRRATTVGNTQRWMITLNISTTLPGRLPFQFYLDAGLFADTIKDNYLKGILLYSPGVKIILLKDVVEIYFPFTFAESKAITDREKLNRPELSYWQKIRFMINLQALNPLSLPGRIRF